MPHLRGKFSVDYMNVRELYANGTPVASEYGNKYYVDALGGSNTNSGKSWATPLLTMAAAFAKLASGDTIFFKGKVLEQLTTPVNVFDVAVIGVGHRPHHADASPAGGNLACATWQVPASPVAVTPLVKVIQQGWLFQNILFAGPADAGCVKLFRNDASGDLERDASHATIRGCRFASGLNGIEIVECYNVGIFDNQFMGMTGFDILGVAGSGVAAPGRPQIRNNTFFGSANHVKMDMIGGLVEGNFFDDGSNPNTTVVLNTDMSTASSSANIVVNNYFQTATANFNTPDVVGSSTDVWTANCTPDAAGAGVSGIYEIGRPA